MLKNFTVIDLIKTRSDSVATVSENAIKFNSATHIELHHASHVQFLISPKDKSFAIRACKAEAPNAVAFSKPEGEQKYPIKISNAAIADAIRKMAEWTDGETWNVPGVYYADEEALVYGVGTAYKPASKGGWAARRKKEAAVSEE